MMILLPRKPMNHRPLHALPLVAAILALLPAAHAKPKPAPDHWVATWATGNIAGPGPIPYSSEGFVPGAVDTTLRQIVHTSLGNSPGDPLVRVEFTNALGTDPLTIGEVHIALADPNGGATTGDISLFSANALTFAGQSAVTIPPGAEIASDPVALKLPFGSDLVITMFLPAQKISSATFHWYSFQTSFYAPGNVVSQRSLTMPPTHSHSMGAWYFLKSVDVKAAPYASAIVAFGDSITDGAAGITNANRRWPDVLARRLHANPPTQNLAVANEGIGGNRVLHDGIGPSALARFDREVLSIPGVGSVIVFEGVNDLGIAYGPNPHDVVTADQLIAGLTQFAERAHAHNLKVFGATVTPYGGAGYYSAAGEQVREALNAWIRTTTVFDGVIDFDKLLQDPAEPTKLAPAYASTDHLHPNDAGLQAMGNAIELQLFK
jgi:lysophospholipase L1-like esterase